MEKFKTLIFVKRETRSYLGRYAVIINKSMGSATVPELMTEKATMKQIKELYPHHNFDNIKLVDVELKVIDNEEI